MILLTNLEDWREYRSGLTSGQVGFVPTMGALHRGHESLIQRSVAENDHTIVSLLVNPTQFDEAADLEAYPDCQQEDLAMLERAGVTAVFMPVADSIYPDDYRYRVTETELSGTLCGAQRAGHFDGVLTVVMRLLNLVKPQRAYFGEKDYQQLELVRGMVTAFFMDVEIIACPTVREEDGLALSSRNLRLDPVQRTRAASLSRLLRNASDTREAERALTEAGFKVDYVTEAMGRRFVAARLGPVRLIDNIPAGERCDEQ